VSTWRHSDSRLERDPLQHRKRGGIRARLGAPPLERLSACAWKALEVEIHYDGGQLRLRVRDDGRGIDSGCWRTRPWKGSAGLRGMPERAALIGGELAVWNEVSAGTEVELRGPGNAAYAAAPRRFTLSRLAADRNYNRRPVSSGSSRATGSVAVELPTSRSPCADTSAVAPSTPYFCTCRHFGHRWATRDSSNVRRTSARWHFDALPSEEPSIDRPSARS
jgi:hypothetical protein